MNKSNGEELNIKVERNNGMLDFKVKPTEVKNRVTRNVFRWKMSSNSSGKRK